MVHRSPRQNDTRLFWPTIKLLPTPARAALNRGRSIARDRERPPARVRLARPPSLGAPQPDAPEAAGAADAENAMEPPRTLPGVTRVTAIPAGSPHSRPTKQRRTQCGPGHKGTTTMAKFTAFANLFATTSSNLLFNSNLLIKKSVINGTDQDDNLTGTSSSDIIVAGAGNDIVHGGGGNDSINGGDGNDILDGGEGNDTLAGGAGNDTLIGGNGVDTVSYASSTKGVMLDLTNGGVTNDASGDTYSGIENVTGSAFGDIIAGNASANVINGGNGEDFLFGMGGDDVINGGAGFDVLRGGAGNDRLIGSGGGNILTGDDAGFFGRDTFVINWDLFQGPDTVKDFQRGFDKLDLGLKASDLGADGRLNVRSFDSSNYDTQRALAESMFNSGDRYIFNTADNTLYHTHAFLGTPGLAAVAILEGVDFLSNADLLI
jgi:hypothetical protein